MFAGQHRAMGELVSKNLARGAFLTTAALVVSIQITVALYQRATWICDDKSWISAVLGQIFYALPWLVILGMQWTRLRRRVTWFLAAVSFVWIVLAGLLAALWVGEWHGPLMGPDFNPSSCDTDDWDSLETMLLVTWLLAWPAAIFFTLYAALAPTSNAPPGAEP